MVFVSGINVTTNNFVYDDLGQPQLGYKGDFRYCYTVDRVRRSVIALGLAPSRSRVCTSLHLLLDTAYIPQGNVYTRNIRGTYSSSSSLPILSLGLPFILLPGS